MTAWQFPVVALLALAAPWVARPAAAQELAPSVLRRGAIAEDLYLAGGRVDVLAEVDGDVIAAGGRVAIGRRIRGDVIAAGGDINITGEVLDDVRAAGGFVTLGARIAGDAIAVGGSVSLPPEGRVAGRTWLAGGDLEVRGQVGRSLRAAGRSIRIAGEIAGDVDLAAQAVEVLPTARIGGRLTYRSPREAVIDPGARIAGAVTHHPIQVADRVARVTGAVLWAGRIVLLLGLMIAGVVLAALFPDFSLGAARTIRSDGWKSLAVGFALLVTTPAAGGVLVITLLGAPLGVALLALWGVALLVGLLAAAIFLGDLLTRLARRESRHAWTIVSAVIGVIALGLFRAIPFLGLPIVLVALVLGLGATGINGYRRYGSARSVSASRS